MIFDKILQFKNLIIVGALAFALGSGIGSATAYNLTANYKDAQMQSALAAQKSAHDDVIAENNAVSGRVNKYQADTIIELMNDKATLIGERNEKVSKLTGEIATLRERNKHGTGGVFIDPYAKPPTCPARVEGTAETAIPDPADTGRLSKETSENLLDYARDAEITRLDLITQYEYSGKVTERYNALVKELERLKLQNTPSSRP